MLPPVVSFVPERPRFSRLGSGSFPGGSLAMLTLLTRKIDFFGGEHFFGGTGLLPEEEHRFVPRRPFGQTVQLERSRFFVGDQTPVYEIGQVQDISPLGIGIKTEVPLQPKEMVRVYLTAQAVDIPLPVFSEVKWVKSCKQHYRAGLQFMR